MFKKLLHSLFAGLTFMAAVAAVPAHAQETDAQTTVKTAVDDVLATIKGDSDLRGGNMQKVFLLVDQKIVPRADFKRTTQIAMGRFWNQATPEQQQQIQDGFKTLLVRTYAGALANVRNQTVSYKPFRAAADDTDVVVRSTVNNNGEPVALDYRMEKSANGWKVYDINISGLWLSETYKNQFAEVISKRGGVSGLVQFLDERNAQLAKGPAK
ncbi:MlaC/ttg2D family ABC transporter substrate-binding protein [Ralstonia pseudosolanacearum]|uniref:Phospholipid-binding protein MlaC n=1 Tax=Ralstonia solanacearum TaxID=305 RepID=A0AA92JZ11_RALSL|nr:phospholipid-binding protein MlaC [Ralstonia pseudosolanacearum]QOK95419.1 phospholipid-binding protein MlaC [Ralstonia pseudosolanacearum]UWD91420.1 phospholipid-binding protein MlaC [Ralstonia pseudosolanacearum]CAH0441372.1 Intermembrane phospholipid transport system binding protein MlaC [Ralstonia pseudosolanacearum]